jgi:hypothetical protein
LTVNDLGRREQTKKPSDLRKLWPAMRSNSLRDGAAWLVEQFNRVLAEEQAILARGGPLG